MLRKILITVALLIFVLILGNIYFFHRIDSVLFLYDAAGKIAYQEILGEACFGIASMPEKVNDRLLIGCSGHILGILSYQRRHFRAREERHRQPLSFAKSR